MSADHDSHVSSPPDDLAPVTLDLSGPLEGAPQRSYVEPSGLARSRSGLLTTLRWLKCELQGIPVGSLHWKSCVVRGIESSSGERMVLHFFGSLQLVDFCSTHILGNSAYTIEYGSAARRQYPPDLIVDYHRLRFFFLRTKQRIVLPGRVNQYLPMKAVWSETLASLPAKHRKELKRILRKNNFTVEVRQGQDTMRHFYRTAYLPYAESRFGKRASISEEGQFLSRHKNAMLLWLRSGSRLVGANVVTWYDDRLRIEDCGLVSGCSGPAGVFDALDYASMLLAQLLGCRELDFGGTRPHVRHGIFRYKAKWATRFRSAHLLTPKIGIRVMNDSNAVRSFLRNNYFLQIVDGSLRVKVLIDDDLDDACEVDELVNTAGRTAVDSLLLISAARRERPAGAGREDIPIRRMSRLDNIALGYLDNG